MGLQRGRKRRTNTLVSLSLCVAILLLIVLLRSATHDLRFWLALAAILISLLCNVLVLFFSGKGRSGRDKSGRRS